MAYISKIWYNSMFFSVFFLLVGCVLSQPYGLPITIKDQNFDQLPQTYRIGIQNFKEGDCQNGADILWQLAKQGDITARYLLAEAIYLGLSPPTDNDAWPVKLNLNALHFYIFATETDSRISIINDINFIEELKTSIPKIIQNLNFGENGKQVFRCYTEQKDWGECKKMALELKIISPFSEFAKSIDDRRKSDVSKLLHPKWYCRRQDTPIQHPPYSGLPGTCFHC